MRSRKRAEAIVMGTCPTPLPAIGTGQLPTRPSIAPLVWALGRPERDKSRALLVAEIQGLERLFSSLTASSPERPVFAWRLGDGYIDLANAVRHEQLEAERAPHDAKSVERAEVADKTTAAARLQAFKYYRILVSQYPKWCRETNANDPTQSTGCMDEVLFTLAVEQRNAHQREDARRTFLELVQNWPQSRFIAGTYVGFGDMFFDEADIDPGRLELAEQSYSAALKASSSELSAYAQYKLGYVAWAKGDFPRAVDQLTKAIATNAQLTSRPNGDLPHTEALSAAARRALIPLFALVAKPETAYDFFKRISGDAPGADDRTFALLDELGELYATTDHGSQAAVIYSDLSRRDAALRRCHEATVARLAKQAAPR